MVFKDMHGKKHGSKTHVLRRTICHLLVLSFGALGARLMLSFQEDSRA